MTKIQAGDLVRADDGRVFVVSSTLPPAVFGPGGKGYSASTLERCPVGEPMTIAEARDWSREGDLATRGLELQGWWAFYNGLKKTWYEARLGWNRWTPNESADRFGADARFVFLGTGSEPLEWPPWDQDRALGLLGVPEGGDRVRALADLYAEAKDLLEARTEDLDAALAKLREPPTERLAPLSELVVAVTTRIGDALMDCGEEPETIALHRALLRWQAEADRAPVLTAIAATPVRVPSDLP